MPHMSLKATCLNSIVTAVLARTLQELELHVPDLTGVEAHGTMPQVLTYGLSSLHLMRCETIVVAQLMYVLFIPISNFSLGACLWSDIILAGAIHHQSQSKALDFKDTSTDNDLSYAAVGPSRAIWDLGIFFSPGLSSNDMRIDQLLNTYPHEVGSLTTSSCFLLLHHRLSPPPHKRISSFPNFK